MSVVNQCIFIAVHNKPNKLRQLFCPFCISSFGTTVKTMKFTVREERVTMQISCEVYCPWNYLYY